MSILVDYNTRVIVQGITGNHGSYHAKLMLDYGTNIVAGVTPGKGGVNFVHNNKQVPVFNSVKEALEFSEAEYSIMFVPAAHAHDAAMEAINCSLNLVIITEHIPVYEMMMIRNEASKKNLTVIGPNCPGIISPEKTKIGIMPGGIFKSGKIGILSRSGTLTYEIVHQLSNNGFGQSTVVGVGGDLIKGMNFIDGLKFFNDDEETEAVVIIGEIGGDDEERTAEFIKTHKYTKPIVAYIAGKTAPEGKTMGHAGAIISGKSGTFFSKKANLESVGIRVATFPFEVPKLLSR